MLISIFASIGAQNLGDELILKNEIKLLEEEYWKDTKFIVFSYDYKNPFFTKANIEYREYFPVWIKNLWNFFKNFINFWSFLNIVWKSDLLVVWWWGIIYDLENQSAREPLDQWLFRTNIFRFFNQKILFFAVWLNIKDKFNLRKVKKIFSDAHKVTVRDKYSHDLLTELWIASEIIKDPVFSEVKDSEKINYMIKKVQSLQFSFKDLEDLDLEWKKIALAFRSGYLSDNSDKLASRFEEWKINEIINYILKKWWEVILLPHSFHKTDLLANDYVFLSKFLRVNEKIRVISSMEEVYKKYIYKEFDICLAMRLHSIILSQVYWIPYIWVSYSTKTDEVLDILSK